MPVSIYIELGEADEFTDFDESTQTFTIDDLNDPSIVADTYTLTITLDDTILTTDYEIQLVIAEGLEETQQETCSTPPEMIEPASKSKFSFTVEEDTFIEEVLPKYQATDTACEITYSIVSSD